ncbi:MAG: ECF-type sigma factor, partial [Planctomycetota bacterium]
MLLRQVREGDDGARERLIEGVYQELRTVAEKQFAREGAGHTLQPTALVAEAWMRLDGHEDEFESRAHFFGAAARAMRQVLIDHARRSR